MWYRSDIGVYGFTMALNIDYLHILGTLFSVKHLLSISSSQLCKVGPRLFSCFTTTLSMPAAFLLLGAAIPFLVCVRSVDVMTSSHLLFVSSIILSTILVPVSMVVLPNGLLEYCFLYAL